MKFRGVVLRTHNQPLVLEELRIHETLKRGQALVRVEFSGVCGRQVDEITGKADTTEFLPHLIGHEGVGVVVDTWQESSSKLKIDQRVIMHWRKGSGINADPPVYRDCHGGTVRGGWVNTLTEYAVVSENRLTEWTEPLEPWHALYGCAIPTGLGVALKPVGAEHLGANCLVIGAGGVGKFILEGLKARETGILRFTDSSPSATHRATSLGFTSLTKPVVTSDHQFQRIYISVVTEETLNLAGYLSADAAQIYIIGLDLLNAANYFAAKFSSKRLETIYCEGGEFNPELDLHKFHKLITETGIEPQRHVSGIWDITQSDTAIRLMQQDPSGRPLVKCT